MAIANTLKALRPGDSALVTWRFAGTKETPVSKRLTVKRITSRSITLVDLDGKFTRGWSIKFADVGNETAFANQIIDITC